MANGTTTTSNGSTNVPVDVFTGQDFYVPSFQIFQGTKDLNNVVPDVLSVTYTDSLTAIDSFDLVVNNWDPDKATSNPGQFESSPFKYSDQNTFDPWQPIELWMGYIRNGKDERQKMLTGEIVTMNPDFPASGGSTLSVKGLNLLHRFRTKQETKPYLNRQDSQIAKMIVADIATAIRQSIPNLTLQLDPTELQTNLGREIPVPYVIMDNQYPILFLLERSRDIGYELFVEELPTIGGQRTVTLHYRPTANSKRVFYSLEWGKSLISFQPTLQTANQVSSVTVRGWDYSGKQKIEATVNRSEVPEVVQPADLDLDQSGLAQKLEIMVDKPFQSAAEAKVVCRQTMLRLAQGIVEAQGKTVGLPNLRAGNKISVTGLGTRFSGVYLVTSTTHTMADSGYTTDFSARMESRLSPSS